MNARNPGIHSSLRNRRRGQRALGLDPAPDIISAAHECDTQSPARKSMEMIATDSSIVLREGMGDGVSAFAANDSIGHASRRAANTT